MLPHFKLRTNVITAFGLMLSVMRLGAAPLPAIKVADNHRYFVKADGTPFFWLGDTAWGIFNHASPEEVDLYLNDRAAKGFTVIQGVVALWDYNHRRNPDGELPFLNRDLAQINEAFYKNVDAILDKVEARGLYMAILPFWNKNFPPVLRSEENQQKMKAYHKFLAQRYARRNVFWVLGGDASGSLPGIIPYTDLMAQGLLEGAKAAGVDKILISYHPTGQQSSSFWFHERPWLDFNSIQSGHFIKTTNFRLVGDDVGKTPIKPTLDMEPGYENITDRLVRDNTNFLRISAGDVRRSAYLAVFAGAAGHTYGNGEVYEFWSPEKGINPPAWSAKLPFRESLKLPGSGQLQFLRYLIESRPQFLRKPDQSLIVGEVSNRALERAAALRASDGSYAFIYVQQARPVTIQLDKISGTTIKAWWYDPRTGKVQAMESFSKKPTREFIPPASGEDWVLVLDDAAKGFPAPGAKAL
jgi:hypothetical protein